MPAIVACRFSTPHRACYIWSAIGFDDGASELAVLKFVVGNPFRFHFCDGLLLHLWPPSLLDEGKPELVLDFLY